jgi:tricorn protease
LDHTIGKRVTLTIEPGARAAAAGTTAARTTAAGTTATGTAATAAGAGNRRDVAVQPINLSTERGLVYRAWVESRRAYVAKASGGRLGYVHMPDMGAASLAQLYVDLDAENHLRDGVVIDVRNNNGGFVNAYALDVFTRRPYLNMTLRGRPTAPARTVLGQRALESPTILVTNQHSLSDAEDFTEGYRKLKLGKVVGEPTAGWIIYTWGARLVDGSALRLPRMRITDSDGKNMELAPRPVDVASVRQLGETAAGKDTQLDVAVRELLAQLGTSKPAPTTQSQLP